MANRRVKNGSSDRFPCLGSKVTADGNFSHEIRRQLLLGRKAMTSLDSALKSRDITQPTKVQIDKATVFLGHIESWTIKDALELTSSNCGAGEYS